MKNKKAVVVVTVLLGLLGISWYLGMQLHQGQITRGGAFADYYSVMLHNLRTGTASLRNYLQGQDVKQLQQANLQLQTVADVARPMVNLVPKGMDGPWSRFMKKDWSIVTKSIDKITMRADYFKPALPTETDLKYLATLVEELEDVIAAMDAPVVATGAAPGVRLRMDEVEKMSKMVQKVVDISSSYLLNGTLPGEAEQAQVSWSAAEAIAREELGLEEAQWRLTGEESSVLELRSGKDYHLLQFAPTAKYRGAMKGLMAGVHRQTGELVMVEWQKPVRSTDVAPEELEQWALAAVEDLPGSKMVYELYQKEDEHPLAVVVRTVDDIPVLTDYMTLTFDAGSGDLLGWEKYSWGTEIGNYEPGVTADEVLEKFAQAQGFPLASLENRGLTVVRSQITDQPTLCYWLVYTSQELDKYDQHLIEHYFINAKNARYQERVGSGW